MERDPELASDRARQDQLDMAAIKQAFEGSRGRYGARKVWHQLRRSGHDIARCTVERLMQAMGLQGVVRGKKVITTNPDTAQPCPDDKVNRAFVADMPNQLWVSDGTYVSSWQGMVSFGPCPRTDGGQALTLRHRRLRPQNRRLARFHLDDHRFRPRCPEPGHLSARTVRG
ncbi:IS3 family transposase [Salipiger sp. 1_MG-2023]|uniref:IS3 family transposase n=1 Tax=Salipiger sp. 1_MG-2023 TaxID=3062665 RepID=UPI0026E4256D|nr:IS3 family transposase [Salipiger sp. 1_MG-2023]MDO6588570.1 IS3 family transposase [Salipiger sp. 1_MG-2023]